MSKNDAAAKKRYERSINSLRKTLRSRPSDDLPRKLKPEGSPELWRILCSTVQALYALSSLDWDAYALAMNRLDHDLRDGARAMHSQFRTYEGYEAYSWIMSKVVENGCSILRVIGDDGDPEFNPHADKMRDIALMSRALLQDIAAKDKE